MTRGDRWIVILALVLTAVGLVMVYSSSSFTAFVRKGDENYFLRQQVFRTLLGLGVLWACARALSVRVLESAAPWILGVACALLSGRASPAVSARAAELGIAHVLQGIEDKLRSFEKLLSQANLKQEQAGFMADELVDLPVLTRCGFACAPHEAPEAVRLRAHYVAAAPAGRGAAREVCELLMRAQGTFERALQGYLR